MTNWSTDMADNQHFQYINKLPYFKEIYEKSKLWLKAYSYPRKEHWTWSAKMAAMSFKIWLLRLLRCVIQAYSYTAKTQKLLKTGCNNVVGATLFNVVNNIVRHCYTWLRADIYTRRYTKVHEDIGSFTSWNNKTKIRRFGHY